MQQPVVRLSTWNEARDALRHRNLRQGLYDEGSALMDGVIVNLHGSDHLARRRLENRLFRRDTFLQWEQQLIPQLIDNVFSQLDDSTEGDMVQIARRTMMRLSSLVAGIDLGVDLASFEKMSDLMAKLAAASTVVHATGNKQDIVDEGNTALTIFLTEYFTASRQRRESLIAQATRGELEWSDLPADVLTVLLTNQDNLELPDHIIAREIAYFPWVGSHSTSAALVHALHHCFTWESEHNGTLSELAINSALLQRFVHESLRLHPASPEATRIATADIQLPCGVHVPAGATVVINMVSANRDPEIFGSTADTFDPHRITPTQAPRWGLTFGTGFHACLGQELAGGPRRRPATRNPVIRRNCGDVAICFSTWWSTSPHSSTRIRRCDSTPCVEELPSKFCFMTLANTHHEVVDVHAHILLEGVMNTCGHAGPEMGVREDGTQFFRAADYVLENVKFVNSAFSNAQMRIEQMDALGLDKQLISPNPITYFYHQPIADALSFHQRTNDEIALTGDRHPRLLGAATLPMQSPEEACKELNRAVSELGLLCSYIGTDINGIPLSHPQFEELWTEHERLGVPVVLHPEPRTGYGGSDPFFDPWDLDIIFGFAMDEGLAVAHFLFGGILDRHPGLHVHVAHGGGFAAFQKGRLEQALERRPWGKGLLTRPFADQWDQISFDTAVHRQDALAFLVETEGPDKVLLGSNFAGWDLEDKYMEKIEALQLSAGDSAKILGGNAKRIFKID